MNEFIELFSLAQEDATILEGTAEDFEDFTRDELVEVILAYQHLETAVLNAILQGHEISGTIKEAGAQCALTCLRIAIDTTERSFN